MAKSGPSRLRPLTLRLLTAPAHAHHNAFAVAGPTCKDLDRNGQSPAITPKATYTPIPKRAGSRSQKIPDIS
ncbi:alpha-galactosidase [Lacticaseibacillus rhamnosus]|nr:alpha-galactosidase [Lacticaseibacillus rhamnosus]